MWGVTIDIELSQGGDEDICCIWQRVFGRC